MDIGLDLRLFGAIAIAILGFAALLTIRGLAIRIAVFAIALFIAAYVAGWRPPLWF
jgi:uncharacterized membrane protein